MRLHEGDRVTITPADTDDYILTFQRHVTVSRVVDGGCMVTAESTYPPDREFGPIPESRLRPGWIEADGRVRA